MRLKNKTATRRSARSSAPSFAYTHSDRATGRARLQPGWLDRAFRGLSNAGGFVGFGALVAPRGGVRFLLFGLTVKGVRYVVVYSSLGYG